VKRPGDEGYAGPARGTLGDPRLTGPDQSPQEQRARRGNRSSRRWAWRNVVLERQEPSSWMKVREEAVLSRTQSPAPRSHRGRHRRAGGRPGRGRGAPGRRRSRRHGPGPPAARGPWQRAIERRALGRVDDEVHCHLLGGAGRNPGGVHPPALETARQRAEAGDEALHPHLVSQALPIGGRARREQVPSALVVGVGERERPEPKGGRPSAGLSWSRGRRTTERSPVWGRVARHPSTLAEPSPTDRPEVLRAPTEVASMSGLKFGRGSRGPPGPPDVDSVRTPVIPSVRRK
jgi:hypothetical protein